MTKKVKLGRFQLNFSDRTSYTLIALVVIIFLGVGVYAIAPNPGHTTNQIDWSGLIPQVKTSNLCLGTDCRPSWPVASQIDWSGTIASMTVTVLSATSISTNSITLGGDTRTSWPSGSGGGVWGGRRVLSDGEQIVAIGTSTYGYCKAYAKVFGNEIKVRAVGKWGTCQSTDKDSGWVSGPTASVTYCGNIKCTATLTYNGVIQSGGNYGVNQITWDGVATDLNAICCESCFKGINFESCGYQPIVKDNYNFDGECYCTYYDASAD